LTTTTVLSLALSLATISSAAAQPAASDKPLAPLLTNLGTWHRPVATSSERAQQFFDQGLRMLYAFNFLEADRSFREAARLDPKMAMAHWGQAMALAPNINAPMPDSDGRTAYSASRQALRLKAQANEADRALIEALAVRFAPDGKGDRAALDKRYAEAMKQAAAKYPDDADVGTLAVAAFMQTTAWDYWLPDGSPKPGVAEGMAALERLIAKHPDHAGLHHYYIHIVEAADEHVRKAEPSADRLLDMMPGAGHIVHMPSHIYLRVGRYADAISANERAAMADEDYIAQCRAQGLYPVAYYPHNIHFLWAAATIEGRSDLAIDTARKVAAKVPHHLGGALPWTHDFPVVPLYAMVRFGRWEEILSEPKPHVPAPYPNAIWHYARAIAKIGRVELDSARDELKKLETVRANPAFTKELADAPLASNVDIAIQEVRAELAAKSGDLTQAIAAATKAVELQDAQAYNEPETWHRPTRLVLGALLLEASRFAAAEKVYQEDLRRHPETGWALVGLRDSLAGQGKTAEAEAADARFKKAWARADFPLTSSRIISRTGAVARSTEAESVEGGITVRRVKLPSGIGVEYAEAGTPNGPAVIMLHGYSDSWFSFSRVIPLLPRDLRLIAVSQRGHGESGRPVTGYSMDDLAGDVIQLMDVLKIERATVIGHSMGSFVARRLVALAPARVSSLVLTGAGIFARSDSVEVMKSTIASLTDPVDVQFIREFQLSTIAKPVPDAFLERVVRESQKLTADVWKQIYAGLTGYKGEESAIACPTLVVGGDKDAVFSTDDQERLAKAIKGASVVIVPGIGHALHWEDPERFVSELKTFLERSMTLSAAAR
jgi:pimeloyl-ACP methyl ester carboxylesterase/tetratricopeptide (TPR) repeat protein